uniref:Aminotransferase class V domain-containing protein n=1 Tax=Parascaris univalens TaxID=6257 RepID=A0A915BRX2_PARUN
MERSFGERVPKFSDFCDEESGGDADEVIDEGILDWLRMNEFGHNEVIDTPFGKRRVYYCDYAASGRPLIDVEEYIRHEVLTFYGNTHSSVTATSEQSTLFLHEARDIIRNAIGASEHDAIIFTGNGTTAAVELLIHLMALDSPIVVSAIHEHHSNLLPWREIASESFIVDESDDGRINVEQLNTTLNEIRRRKGNRVPIIGCFTAASNITGLCVDVDAITAILNR